MLLFGANVCSVSEYLFMYTYKLRCIKVQLQFTYARAPICDMLHYMY